MEQIGLLFNFIFVIQNQKNIMASKKFDFKKPMLDIDGEPAKESGKQLICGDLLAQALMEARMSEEDIILKFFAWALELKKTGVISLDKVDEDKLRKWILTNPSIMNLGKGRFIEVLDNPIGK